MKYRPIKLAIVVMSMLISFGSFAQGPPGGSHGGKQGGGPNKGEKPDASEILKLLDINSDGKIDKDEASKDERGKIAEDFEITDSNEDGYIDIEELEASLDSSKPKKISVKALLKAVDQNEDGQLNELEVAA
ncbi:EF-hand domain-containing protein [Winogradskyella sediminis]|uniref:EF-hand domain-containing protein n=1 Tax=Winogradskyella sediminis TaxID=1382466 RepID=UPI003AA93BAD